MDNLVNELIENARTLGIDTPERVILHLRQMIDSNLQYVTRRANRGHQTDYDKTVARHSAVLAMAIHLIQQQEKN